MSDTPTAAVHRAHERIQGLYRHAPMALLSVDADLRVAEVNDAAKTLFGGGDLVGAELGPCVGHAEEIDTAVRTALGGGKPWAGRVELALGGNGTRIYDVEVSPLAPGDACGIALVDVTMQVVEQQLAQDRQAVLEAILETSNDALFTCEADGTILSVNRPGEHMLGWSADELHGTKLHMLIAPGGDGADHAFIEQALHDTSTSPTETREVTALRKDRSEMPGELKIGVAAGNEQQEAVACLRDMSLQRECEAALAQMQERFVQAQKMEVVGRMAGGIAHDFKNLLAGILGVVQIASAQTMGVPGAADATRLIRDAALRGVEMVEELLAISRAVPMEPAPVDLTRRIGDSMPMYCNLMGRHVTITCELPHEPMVVLADPGQLDRLLLNLLVNARDAMPTGGQLSITLGRADDSGLDPEGNERRGDWVRLSVRDTGEGMDAQTRSKIFEPFFTTKADGKGTGLGLAMVYATVRQLEGTIALHSEPGEGTEFVLSFPRHGGPVARSATEPEAQRGWGKVLVVDDDELVRLAMEHELSTLGYEPILAASGHEALEKMATLGSEVRAVLSDVRMHHMSGPELAVRIRQERPEVPVLLMTAQPSVLAADRRVAPDQIVLEKPFGRPLLAQRLGEVLRATERPLGADVAAPR